MKELRGDISRALLRRLLDAPLLRIPYFAANTKIGRRSFLTGSAAVVASAASGTADKLEFRWEPPNKDAFLRVILGKQEWAIDAEAFAPGAKLKLVEDQSADFHEVSLTQARYPGLDLVADFKAEFYRREDRWFIRIAFAIGQVAVELPLLEWMQSSVTNKGSAFYSTLLPEGRRRIAFGNGAMRVILSGHRSEVVIDRNFQITLTFAQQTYLEAPRLKFHLHGLDVQLSDKPRDDVPPAAKGPFTKFEFILPEAAFEEITIGRLGTAATPQRVALALDGLPSIGATGFLIANAHDGMIVVRGKGALAIHGNGSGPTGARIQLESAVLAGRVNSIQQRLRFGARVLQSAHGIEADSTSVVIGGHDVDSVIVEQEFGEAPIPSLSIRALLYGAHIPVSGGSSADLTFVPPLPIQIQFGALPAKQPFDKEVTAPGCEAAFWISHNASRFMAPLEDSRLRLRRGLDTFDLSYGFMHYALRVEDSTTALVQRWAFAAACKAQFGAPQIIVHFPPQYEFEEAFSPQRSGLPAPPAQPQAAGLPAECRRPAEPVRRYFGDRDIEPDLARTKLANPSRLVFQDPAHDTPAARAKTGDLSRVELTVETITDWQDLSLVVNKRALDRGATLTTQLKAAGIDRQDTRQDARVKVRKLITSDLDDGLDDLLPSQTSIEPFYRLRVSPDSRAKWTTRRAEPDKRFPKVWSTELANPEATAVRALWARGMDLEFLEKGGGNRPPDSDGPFVGSLNANDRRELVGLTSIYGLAALRRLVPLDKNVPKSGWQDDPNGMVFLPPEKYRYLDYTGPYPDYDPPQQGEPDRRGIPQEGVMLAKPFDRFQMRLGRNATVDAYWKGEPPAGYTAGDLGPFFAPAFTIERYVQRAQQGRDTFVEVTYKGFLFPIGHRAARLKVTYRDFAAYLDDVDGGPTAYLMQEEFIVCPQPDKTFKAYNQPYASNDFPATAVKMISVRTGSLEQADRTKFPLSAPLPAGVQDLKSDPSCKDRANLMGLAFWPTLLGGAPVEFEYQIDKAAPTARSQLLFVDNAAAHDPDTVELIVGAYNALALDDPRRRVFHPAAVRRYATEGKTGEASFKTYEWTLSARGRIYSKSGSEAESFNMDAFMEGEDQPPFYPIVEKAKISVEKIERLTGKFNQPIEVAFNANYVRNGFEPSHNPSEIYLDVLGPDIGLDAHDSGGSTGGLAAPNMLLTGLSRKIGLVGGRKLIPPATPTVPAFAVAVVGSPQAKVGGSTVRNYDMQAAEAGRLDPFQFLKPGASLFGLPLADVIKTALITAAPKLVEKLNHAVQAANTTAADVVTATADIMRPASATIFKAVDQLLKDLDERPKKRVEDDPVPGLNFQQLYPDLHGKLNALRAAANEASTYFQQAPAKLTLKDSLERVDAFKATTEEVLNALAEIGRDPIPTVIRKAMTDIQDAWTTVRRVFEKEDVLRAALKQLTTSLTNVVLDEICVAVVETQAGEALLGRLTRINSDSNNPDARKAAMLATCKRFLTNPTDVLPQIQDVLLYDVLAEPLARAAAAAQRVMSEWSAAITWSRRIVAQQIASALRRGASEFTDTVFEEVADEIVESIANDTSSTLANEPLEKILPAFRGSIERAFEAQKDKLIQALRLAASKAAADLKANAEEIAKQHAKHADGLSVEARKTYDLLLAKKSRLEVKAKEIGALEEIFSSKEKRTLLLDAVKTAVEAEVRSAVARVLAEVEEAKKQGLDGISRKLISFFEAQLNLLERSTELTSAMAFIEKLKGWCGTAKAELFRAADAVAVQLMGTSDLIANRAKSVQERLLSAIDTVGRLTIPPQVPADIREKLSAASASLARTVQIIDKLLVEQQEARVSWEKVRDEANSACTHFQAMLDPASRLVALRQRIAEAIGNAINTIDVSVSIAEEFAETVQGAKPTAGHRANLLDTPENDIKRFADELKKAAAELVDLSLLTSIVEQVANETPTWKSIVQIGDGGRLNLNLQPISDAAKKMSALIAAARNAAANPVGRWEELKTSAKALTEALRIYAIESDRRVVALVLQTTLGEKFARDVQASAFKAVKPVATFLLPPHDEAAKALGSVIKVVTGDGQPEGWSAMRAFISQDTLGRLAGAKKLIEDDASTLQSISTSADAAAAASHVQVLRKRWAVNGGAGLVIGFEVVRQIVESVSHGNLTVLFDIGALEQKLRESIKALVPTRASLTYDFDTEIGSFPAGDPVFAMDREQFGEGEDEYDPNHPPINDLVLKTSVLVDFATGQREVAAEGRLRPFKINLLGRGLDLATIHFRGARFKSKPGQRSEFVANIGRVQIGSMLSFLDVVKNFLGAGKDNGFYTQFRPMPSEIEVGYRYSEPLIQLGSMQLINLGFNVSALLPLDDRQTMFRMAIATAEHPFLIAQPPYGGGGFFALKANVRGIIGVQVQLEFGGVVSFEFGPLSAHGRITAGFYFESESGRRALEGFVHAVGEGNIACFGISANIEIRTYQDEDSNMVGSSRYAFSFSLGIVDFDFEVTAGHKQNGSKRRDSSQPASTRQVARIQEHRLLVPAIRKEESWDRYRNYLDI